MKLHRSRNTGFSLVEVTLAVGIAGFALLAIFGLLPVGINSSQAASGQTAANGILTDIVTDIEATPPGLSTSARFGIRLPAASAGSSDQTLYFDSEGKPATEAAADARYRVRIDFLPTQNVSDATAPATLRVTWPAQASSDKAAGAVQTFVAFTRN